MDETERTTQNDGQEPSRLAEQIGASALPGGGSADAGRALQDVAGGPDCGNRCLNTEAGSSTKPSGPKVTVKASRKPLWPRITAVP